MARRRPTSTRSEAYRITVASIDDSLHEFLLLTDTHLWDVLNSSEKPEQLGRKVHAGEASKLKIPKWFTSTGGGGDGAALNVSYSVCLRAPDTDLFT